MATPSAAVHRPAHVLLLRFVSQSSAVDAGKATITRRAKVFFPGMSLRCAAGVRWLTVRACACGCVRVLCTGETDEEIEKRIEANPRDFIREALQQEVANEKVQQVYRDVTTRAREVELLANSIREVHEMFQDFAALVAQQHEQIDSIETTVSLLRPVTTTGMLWS